MAVPRIVLMAEEIYFAREFNHVCSRFFFHVLVNVNQMTHFQILYYKTHVM